MQQRHRFVFAARTAPPLCLGGLLFACWIEVETPPRADGSQDFDPEWQGNYDSGDWGAEPVPRQPPAYPELPGEPALDPPPEPSLPRGYYRDLIVLDPAIVHGPLADNTDPEAPFAFRAQMQWLAGPSRDPFDFARNWLERWATESSVGTEGAPVTPRAAVVPVLLESWLAPSAALAMPDGSPLAPSAMPDWKNTPFRLIAIVNRLDLAGDPCAGPAGELRYVYAAADVEAYSPLAATLILEIPYPSTRSAAQWALAWADVAASSDGDYPRELAKLLREVQRDADPLRVRLRSNEIALAGSSAEGWEMREFQLRIVSGQLELVQVPLEFTPRADADPASLAEHVLNNAETILDAASSLPEPLRAGAAEIGTPDFSWPVLGVSERLRQAFSVQTCNGCHGGDARALPFQHIAAGPSFADWARLSPFLYDPASESDELRRREIVMRSLTDAFCEDDDGFDPGYPGG